MSSAAGALLPKGGGGPRRRWPFRRSDRFGDPQANRLRHGPRIGQEDRPLRRRYGGTAHREPRLGDFRQHFRAGAALAPCSGRARHGVGHGDADVPAGRALHAERGAHRASGEKGPGVPIVRVFNLPDLGEGLQEAEIVEWHVKAGETVESDKPMVSVETDKAIVEVPAPYSGKVEKLFGNPGDKVHVGAPLIGFEGAAADTGTVVGNLDARAETKTQARPARAESRPQVKATPAVRALARSLNVELASVEPTGPGATATTEDVKRAARGSLPVQASAQKG